MSQVVQLPTRTRSSKAAVQKWYDGLDKEMVKSILRRKIHPSRVEVIDDHTVIIWNTHRRPKRKRT